jgi:parallel beta-helix repeat protein
MFKKINYTRNSKLISNIAIFSICLILLQIITFSYTSQAQLASNDIFEVQPSKIIINPKFVALSYQSHAIISINGNSDFASQAIANSWNGSGTANDPYIISGYEIQGTGSENLLTIQNTDVYFTLQNLYLHHGNRGIYLKQVKHGNLTNNIANDNSRAGFSFETSNENFLSYNFATNNTPYGAIDFYLSTNNIIYNNTLINNGAPGIYLWESNENIT